MFIFDDLTEFFYDADPKYKQVGTRAKNMIDTGMWDDPWAYDGTYAGAAEWGERRWATPGVVMDGKLITTNLHHINMGLEEFVEHSYYDSWENDGYPYPTDPAGNPLGPNHPWNKETKPRSDVRTWKDRYTWSTAPRWDRQVVEAGAYARMWTTAAAGIMPHNRFLEATGTSIKMDVPQTASLPAMELEWKIPETWNAFERNRARAYHVLYSLLVGYENVQMAFDLMGQGENKVATMTEFRIPRRAAGRRVLGSRARLPDPPPDDGQGRPDQLPDHHAVDLQRLPGRPVRPARPVRGGGREHPDPGGVRVGRDVHRDRRLPCHPVLRPVHAVHRARRQRRQHDHPRRDHVRVRRRVMLSTAQADLAGPERVLIGGVGYRWFGDGSFALLASDALAALEWPTGVDVLDLGYGALHVALDLTDVDPPYERVVLLAVTERGREPGQLYRFRSPPAVPDLEDVQARMYEAGAGVIDLDHVLVIGRHFGALPDDVVVVEFEPQPGTTGRS